MRSGLTKREEAQIDTIAHRTIRSRRTRICWWCKKSFKGKPGLAKHLKMEADKAMDQLFKKFYPDG